MTPRNLNKKIKCFTGTVSMAIGLFVVPFAAQSQVPQIYGALSNFDAANYESVNAYGFDIQLEGMQPADFGPSYWNRYGSAQNYAYKDPVTGVSGTIVRYQSPKNSNGVFLVHTVPHDPNIPFNGTCYALVDNLSGCDHFGVHPNVWNPTLYSVMAITGQQAVYHWLIEDVNNPGELVRAQNGVIVPTPYFYFVPPAAPTQSPVLEAVVQLPPPPPPVIPQPIPQYGEATWVKVFKSEQERPVDLAELVTTVNDAEGLPIRDANGDVIPNPIVPQDPATTELNWTVLQASPPSDSNGNHRQRGRIELGSAPKSGSKSVVRRYETYAYTGAYDPITHEARCAGDPNDLANLPLSCNAPMPGELGAMQVAQMVAANIVVPSLTVTVNGSGKGSVTSTDKVIQCPSKTCSSPYSSTPPAADPVVRLTANVGAGVFAGWSGSAIANACGRNLTCDVTVTTQEAITATFKSVYAVGVATNNTGSITAALGGTNVLNCGLNNKTCSAKITDGTLLSFTATPIAGKTFLGWSGDASSCGLATNCVLTVGGNLSIKASFSK